MYTINTLIKKNDDQDKTFEPIDLHLYVQIQN